MKTSVNPLISALKKLLKKSFYVYSSVRLNHSFKKDYGLTYQELCELTNELEYLTGQELSEPSLRSIDTVGDLINAFRSAPIPLPATALSATLR
ncbi:hypothetical protein BWI93_10485 [Siphonobacter sp. BAB-5385]|uniref:hypothetical protein n=1 Tax=unclassified Siphonobacter TaxID=2635712 RepID=UPI000B9E1BCB|nr:MULTISPECIES: hypothetical protein [unclassified Siphonobacter]OZI08282.1 hypothetical protein BWI93_10485 [Siphonobacter sp. BAB-5385]PMD97359.1 hypothetical protein BWI97_06930 [Siphonobacter sp. BAB-5405]